MQKQEIIKSLKELRDNSKKRNFSQTFDLIINLQQLDLKKLEHKIEIFMSLPKGKGRKQKICALVGNELLAEAKKNFEAVIHEKEFSKYQTNKLELKKMAKKFDWFLAQATIMPKVATTFGKVLGPRGKMPNPKAGCLVPPNANLEIIKEKLENTIRVGVKNDATIRCSIGNEGMSDEDLAENVYYVYSNLVHALPSEENNVKQVLVKMTMSKPVEVSKR